MSWLQKLLGKGAGEGKDSSQKADKHHNSVSSDISQDVRQTVVEGKADEVKKLVNDLNAEQRKQVLQLEKQNKNRKSVISHIERKLSQEDGDQEKTSVEPEKQDTIVCSECDKTFKTQNEYRKHRTQHEPEKSTEKLQKLKTHVPGFDDLMTEGIPEGSAILLEGGPGSGKTLFGLTMLYKACLEGHKVLYMSFEEPERRLVDHMKDFGFEPDTLIEQDLLRIKRYNALDISRSVEALLSEAKRELMIDVKPMLFPDDFEPDIVVVDSLTSIASAFSGQESRFRIYMEQLFRYLEKEDITSFLIRETPQPTHLGAARGGVEEAVSFLSDGIIVLYNVFRKSGARESALEILKLRGENFKKKLVKFDIKPDRGFVVYPNDEFTGEYTLT